MFGRSKGSPTLVLKEFRLNENGDEFLFIKGRMAGFLGWILSLMKIDPITSLTCSKDSIKFETASFSGKNTTNVPLKSVTGVTTGISKPVWLFVLGILIFIFGIIVAIVNRSAGPIFVFIIFSALCIVFYFLNKTTKFWIHYGGRDSPAIAINVKKSIIEGQDIDVNKYETAANVIKNAVINI